MGENQLGVRLVVENQLVGRLMVSNNSESKREAFPFEYYKPKRKWNVALNNRNTHRSSEKN